MNDIDVWADNNETITDLLHFRFLQDGASQIGPIVNVTGGAEASVDWVYPDDGNAHTVTVYVWGTEGENLTQMVEPVSLEVYSETELRFSVERGDTSEHTFQGQLLKTRGGVVAGMPVKVYINDTLYETYTTDSNGYFSFTRNFDEKILKNHTNMLVS